ALGALRRQAQKGARGRVNNIDIDIVALARTILLVAREPGGGEEAGCDQMLVGIGGNLVASELLPHEVCEGEIAIETLDDPVAVTPGERTQVIALIAFGFGPARDVEPMPTPTLAIMRACQESVHDSLPNSSL